MLKSSYKSQLSGEVKWSEEGLDEQDISFKDSVPNSIFEKDDANLYAQYKPTWGEVLV